MTTAPSIVSYAQLSAVLVSGQTCASPIFCGASIALVPGPLNASHNLDVFFRLLHCDPVPSPPVSPHAVISTSARENPFAVYIVPSKDSYTTVNGQHISGFTKLHDGDNILIRDCAEIIVNFRERAIPNTFETRASRPPDENGALAPLDGEDTFAVSGEMSSERQGESFNLLETPHYVRQLPPEQPPVAEFLSVHAPLESRTARLFAEAMPDGMMALAGASPEELMGLLSKSLQRVMGGNTEEPEMDLYQLVRIAGEAILADFPYVRHEIELGPERPLAMANKLLGRSVDTQGVLERLGCLHKVIGRPFTHVCGAIPKEEELAVTIADVLNNMMTSLRGHVEHGLRLVGRGGGALDWGILYDNRIPECGRFNRAGRFALACFMRDVVCECRQKGFFVIEDIDRYSGFTQRMPLAEQTMQSWWMLLDALAARPKDWLSPEEGNVKM